MFCWYYLSLFQQILFYFYLNYVSTYRSSSYTDLYSWTSSNKFIKYVHTWSLLLLTEDALLSNCRVVAEVSETAEIPEGAWVCDVCNGAEVWGDADVSKGTWDVDNNAGDGNDDDDNGGGVGTRGGDEGGAGDAVNKTDEGAEGGDWSFIFSIRTFFFLT